MQKIKSFILVSIIIIFSLILPGVPVFAQVLNSADYSLSNFTYSNLGNFSGEGTLLITDQSVLSRLSYNPNRSWRVGSPVGNVMQLGDTYLFGLGRTPWRNLINGDHYKTSIADGFASAGSLSLNEFIAANPDLANQGVRTNPLLESIIYDRDSHAYKGSVKSEILKNSDLINGFVKENPWALNVPVNGLIQGEWEGRLSPEIKEALSSSITNNPTLRTLSLNDFIVAANSNDNGYALPNFTYGQFAAAHPDIANTPIAALTDITKFATTTIPLLSNTEIANLPIGNQSILDAGIASALPLGNGGDGIGEILSIGIADFDLADRISGKAAQPLTGGTKDGKFKAEDCDGALADGSKDEPGECSNIEVNNSISLKGLLTNNILGDVNGFQIIHKEQIVDGGEGALGRIVNKEPTGWKPWGMKPPLKLVMANINQQETEANLEIYMQICDRSPIDMGCIAHVIGPIPAPPPLSPIVDKGKILIATLNGPPPITPPGTGGAGGCGTGGGQIPKPSDDPSASPSERNLKRYLDRIAWGESSGGVNLGPNEIGAYGKYQFIPSTRAAILSKYGYDAWNPSQWDNASISLIKDVGGSELLAAISSGNFAAADRALNRTWTSLPGGAESNWTQASLALYGPVTDSKPIGDPTPDGPPIAGGDGCGGTPCPEGQVCPLHHPLPSGILVSGYGWRPSTGSFHRGLDISTRSDSNPGAPVLAAADGVVAATPDYFGRCRNYGYRIELQHPGRNIYTTYNHLASRSISPGSKITRGQRIGVEGSTSCGMITHLHYEVQRGPGIANGDFDPLSLPHEPAIR